MQKGSLRSPGPSAEPSVPATEHLYAIHPVAAGLPPPLFALAIAESGNGVLLVCNRKRDAWELPGGWIDPGETPLQCIQREVIEESGQTLIDVELCAIAQLATQDSNRGVDDMRFGAIYRGSVDAFAPFVPTAEIEAASFFSPDALPANLSLIDAQLLAWHFRSRAEAGR